MAFETDRRYMSAAQAQDAQIDVGLRQYMLRVYNYMASGVALTGIVAYLAASSPAILGMLYAQGPQGLEPTGIAYLVMFAPLAFILALTFGVSRMSTTTVQTLFWLFAGVMGLSLANIFLIYTGTSIARVFFITAASFAGLSLYGYTTKRDLSAMGSFMIMGLWGIVLASLVNLFLASSALQFAISVIGVLVFAGLTAYDTQKIREMYWEGDTGDVATKKAVMGALTLYLDFINMLLLLLRFFGDRR